MGYLARLISTQLQDKMGSWEGDPFAVKIVPEIYLELLQSNAFEEGKVETIVMTPGVSATTVVKAFNSMHIADGVESRNGAEYKMLSTKVDPATLDLKFRFLLGDHDDEFLKLSVSERMAHPVQEQIIDYYCTNNTNQTDLGSLLIDEDELPEIANLV